MNQSSQLATFYLAKTTLGTSWPLFEELMVQAGFNPVDYTLADYLKPTAQGLKNQVNSPGISHLNQNNFEHLQGWLDDFTDTHFFLVYTRPEVYLQQALSEGQQATQALQSWSQEVQELLNIQRSNRSRTSLIQLEQALQAPDELMQKLSEKLGWTFPEKNWNTQPLQLTENQELLLSSQIVMQDTGLQQLLAELEASSLNQASLLRPLKLDTEQLQQKIKEGSQQQLEKLNATQEELKKQLNNYQDLKSKSETDLKNLQENLQNQQKKLKEVEEENELLIEQLHFTQEELEKQLLKGNKDHEAQLTQLKKELKEVKQSKTRLLEKYRAVFQSTSWKITKPLRALSRLLKGKPLRAKPAQGGNR
ncbi:hypothetical protein SAMN05660443_0440 [Marinospirillum celere]|uniref:Uncharacterized protein n=1 Tax=Marinospirillum celere TaxID=1122252 RepID=A0A1I1EAD9_9GAMM|nr:hypothetical protein [Marinospirillum celere]SFB83552.1 hypothetical protein SAMN05660443_0440 [Marinospirillum celere]